MATEWGKGRRIMEGLTAQLELSRLFDIERGWRFLSTEIVDFLALLADKHLAIGVFAAEGISDNRHCRC